MVASPNYERLKVFMEAARANKGLDAWDGDHDKALKGFDDAVERLRAYRESHGFTGATGRAMDHWVDASITRIEKYREGYERGYHTYSRGRNVMATALSEAETLSPDLLDANTAAMRDDLLVSVPSSEPGTGIRFMGKLYTTGAAYVAAVEEQANEQREAAAKRIIDMVNNRTSTISGIMKGQITDKLGDPGPELEHFEQEETEIRVAAVVAPTAVVAPVAVLVVLAAATGDTVRAMTLVAPRIVALLLPTTPVASTSRGGVRPTLPRPATASSPRARFPRRNPPTARPDRARTPSPIPRTLWAGICCIRA